jgi:uncharacterized membrane protein
MIKTVLGVFDNTAEAEAALKKLETEGFNPKDMSIIMKDTNESQRVAQNTGANVADGVAAGATTGAVLGTIAGLLVGIGAIVIPGGFLIGGPIAAALGLTGAAASTVTGAATGALAGGLLGGLVKLGIPESEARVYEERVNAGAILVAVPTRNDNEDEVRQILEENSATNIRSISMT